MKKTRALAVGIVALAVVGLGTAVLAACGSSDKQASASPSSDVVAAALSTGQLSQFAAAVKVDGLDGTLAGKGPLTVFAPSNAALTASGASMTADVLKVHVIQGQELAKADLEKGTKNGSLVDGNDIVTYTGNDGNLYVNTYKVVAGPIKAGNGVVYVIDGVIEPKS